MEHKANNIDVNRTPLRWAGGLYTYERHGIGWAVYRWQHSGTGSRGTKVSEHFTRGEARGEAYRLNGWKAPSGSPAGGEVEK